MAWTSGKRLRKKKMKRMRKIKWEESGLGAPLIKEPVLIEEIRLQGIMLAYRGVGQGVRSRHSGGQGVNPDRPAPVIHRRRRGATG